MKKIVLLSVFLLMVSFLFLSNVVADENFNTLTKDYGIVEIVPDEVFLLQWYKVGRYDISLEKGIKELGKKYRIKNGIPIIKPRGSASTTSKIIFIVEPREKKNKP